MGTPWSGSSDAVGSAVVIAPARATGNRRFITHLNVDLGATATNVEIDSSNGSLTPFKVYQDLSGVEIPPIYSGPNASITATAQAGVVSLVQMSGYDEEVGEGQGFASANVSEATASSSTVYATLRAPLSTTEVIAVHKALLLPEATANQNLAVGYATDAAGTGWEAITPSELGIKSYNLGSMEIPAGKYLLLQNIEASGVAKDSTAIVSLRILKP